jgi:hypothetical protein
VGAQTCAGLLCEFRNCVDYSSLDSEANYAFAMIEAVKDNNTTTISNGVS